MSARHLLAGTLLLLFGSGVPLAAQQVLSLSDALRFAATHHPRLRAVEADVARARGLLSTARTLAPNPTGSVTVGPARSADTSLTSYQVGLSQILELGGKRRWRTRSAAERVHVAEALQEQERRVVAWGVERAFRLVQLARVRAAVTAGADSAGQVLLTAARERLALGAGTQLELNVASAAAARDRRARLSAEQGVRAALSEFLATIGAGAADTVVPDTTPLPDLPMTLPPEADLVATALASRADLRALEATSAAAEAEVRLAGAMGWPDPEFGVAAGKAEDFRVTLFSVALPLPLWSRNAGGRSTARAGRDRALIELEAARQEAARAVRLAAQGYQAAREAELAFDRDAVGRLGQNLELAQESFRSGKIGLITYNQVRRDLIEARLAHLDALAESANAWQALQLAAGQIPGGLE